MGALRDIIARYAISVDDKPLTDVDRKIQKLNDRLKSVARWSAVGFGIAAAGAFKLVTAASDAEEALNVLRQTFKENSDGVVKWSQTLAKQMGRSEFTLQESVGRFGAFLAPVFKESNVDIAQMSERLSELAVDLASFYNTSDSEAIMRLFSGISGETEAVRRLGINISDSALAELNKKKGDTRDYNVLTLAEKTALRFEKILIDSANVQGDAIRTAGEWANSLKRVNEQMKTFAVRLGRVLKKVALPLLHTFEKIINKVGPFIINLVKRTQTLEVALAACAVAAGAMAAEFVVMQLALPGMIPLLVAGLQSAAISAAKIATSFAAFLVIEDVVTFLQGGDSILGSWLKSAWGITRPLGIIEGFFERISASIHNTGVRLTAVGIKTLALSRLAVGDFDGYNAGMKGADAYRSRELIDVDVVQKKRGRVNEEMFRDLVRNGSNASLNEAAKRYHMPSESPEAAFARAKQMRRLMVASGEVAPTPDDIKSFGLKAPFVTPQSAAQATSGGDPISPYNPGSPTPGFSVRTPLNPGARSNPLIIEKVEVNVQSAAEAEEAGRAFVKGMLRDAYNADGELMSEEPDAGAEVAP